MPATTQLFFIQISYKMKYPIDTIKILYSYSRHIYRIKQINYRKYCSPRHKNNR